jgi:NAD(P)-dependent dehydrogenase (short-subunit alcohol dehydrogenase family)
MSEKVVLITGANGALGSAITNLFLAQGHRVIGASLNISAKDFPQANFQPLSLDFTDVDKVRAAIQSLVEKYHRLDALVHVMGAFAGGQSIAHTTDQTWNQMQNLNLNSAFYVLRETVPHLRKSGQGRIVVIGSLAAREPHANLGAYVVFKSALSTLVRTIAAENSDAGLTANVILPDTMDTPANRRDMPQADFSKWLPVAQVAELVLWLTDNSAAHITGTEIPITAARS